MNFGRDAYIENLTFKNPSIFVQHILEYSLPTLCAEFAFARKSEIEMFETGQKYLNLKNTVG